MSILDYSSAKRRLWKLLIVSGLLVNSWGCARAPYQYRPLASPAAATAPSPAATPQLLFLAFRMQAAPRELTLVSAKAVPGHAIGLGEDETGTTYLTITQLDASQQPCAPSVRVPHPLLRDVEYPDEASGTLERREAALSEAEFFVRMVRQPTTVAVRVQEVAPAVATPLTLTLSLPLAKP